jgi:hypothetical protein
VLELEHRLRVEEVILALSAPLVLAAQLEVAVRELVGPVGVRTRVTTAHLFGDLVEPDAIEARHRAGEVLLHELVAEADCLEHLRAAVRRDRGDAHLRHHLEHALAARLDVALDRLLRVVAPEAVEVVGDEVLDRLEREVRVHRAGAVAEQQRHVVHLTRVARLDHEADLRAGLLADQVVVHTRHQQQRRDRRPLGARVAVGQHDDARAVGDRDRRLATHAVHRLAQRVPAAVHAVQTRDHVRRELGVLAVVVDVNELGQLVVVEDAVRQLDLATRRRARVEEVALGSHRRRERRDELLTDRVERWVGDLCEQLREIVEQHARPV